MKKTKKVKAKMLKGRKRIKLPIIILCGFIISLLSTFCFYKCLNNYVTNYVESQIDFCTNQTRAKIDDVFESAKELPADSDKTAYLNSKIGAAVDKWNIVELKGILSLLNVGRPEVCITPYSGIYDVDVTVTPERKTDSDAYEFTQKYGYKDLTENESTLSGESYTTIVFEKKVYDVIVKSVISLDDPQIVRFSRGTVAIFFIVLSLMIFLFCLRKYTINKTECDYEDYRRDLTGHLAHDIKTPLMAISGYAENIMETDPDEKRRKKYLDSIMGNVEFTKKLIERTAVLNSIENSSGKLNKEKINIEETLKTLFDKYSVKFNERKIDVSLSGNADVNANRESTESLLENLISNAVKYTSKSGTLKAEISPKKLVITNTVEEKISTKDLKRPFVRGDKSRSNTRGTGLGLSIAESAAQLNGFKLKLNCTDKEFVSEIIFQ
ncbi:MAG: HAMP domain-containing histidine kinase [Oscillospiraceae bacterium]|nr:HAMP domain-containing histidine kinase [Oscillospiraceae bacterium]